MLFQIAALPAAAEIVAVIASFAAGAFAAGETVAEPVPPHCQGQPYWDWGRTHWKWAWQFGAWL